MKIEKLYYFLSVAKHLNFTRAAQECHIAQPAISEQISSLEKELGVRLFERGTRSIRLTAAGEVFYQHISRFVQNYEQSLREVRTSMQEKSLVIGVNHFNLPLLLSGAVRNSRSDFLLLVSNIGPPAPFLRKPFWPRTVAMWSLPGENREGFRAASWRRFYFRGLRLFCCMRDIRWLAILF